jgi:hypothetical protein
MFMVPIPEDWDPAEHGWRPADRRVDLSGTTEWLHRWAPPVRFPASLTIFRNPFTGQRVAWYGPLATEDAEQIRQGALLAEIGITSADWGPEDRQPEMGRQR